MLRGTAYALYIICHYSRFSKSDVVRNVVNVYINQKSEFVRVDDYFGMGNYFKLLGDNILLYYTYTYYIRFNITDLFNHYTTFYVYVPISHLF